MDAFDEEAMPEEQGALDAIHELIGLDGVKSSRKFINISKINKIKQQKGCNQICQPCIRYLLGIQVPVKQRLRV